jgi:hypothetical protein
MRWEVEYTDQFEKWWDSLSETQWEELGAAIEKLEERGPGLGRPLVDTISTSRHHNMKELRPVASGNVRVLFVFDPRRHAILLVGGDKTGRWRSWYDEYIPIADDLYDEYLRELREEGLL